MNGPTTQVAHLTARDIERLLRAGRIRQAIAALDAAALEPAQRLPFAEATCGSVRSGQEPLGIGCETWMLRFGRGKDFIHATN